MKTALITSGLLLGIASAEEATPLTLVQTIALPGVEGRIDHFAIDSKEQRLFMAALGNNTVEVIDLAASKVIHQITGLKEPQGVAFIPDTHEVVVANGDDGSVRFFDATTWKLSHTVDLTGDADNVRYDGAKHLVYVGYGDGGIAAIDPTTHLTTATIPLPGHPESFALETSETRIFVNVPNAHQIAVLDRLTNSALAPWDIGAGYAEFFVAPHNRASANFPMTMDQANHRLFIGCRKPARLLVFDTSNNKPIADIALSGDTDDIFYDETSKCLLVSCGEGYIDVINQIDPDHYRRIMQVPTAVGARTSWWIPQTRRLYLAVPHRGAQAAEVRVFSFHP